MNADSSSWICAAASSVGADHIRRQWPCQDAALALSVPRATVIACDGKGSSSHSQKGSVAAIAAWPEVMSDLEGTIADCLDAAEHTSEQRTVLWRTVSEQVCRRLSSAQAAAARENGLPCQDLGYTLAAAVVGSHAVGWMQVGDAAVVAATSRQLELVRVPEIAPFANWTVFVTPDLDVARDLHTGVIAARPLAGLAAMTDGMTFHFVDRSASRPARAVQQLLDGLRQGALDNVRLQQIVDDARWSERNGDDRGIALVARVETASDISLGTREDAKPPGSSA